MSKKYEKSCKTCKLVCKKNKLCKNFLPGIESYQVCFYDKIGKETLDTCFDENFVFPTEKGSIPFESIGFITSYLDKYNSGIRVFVNYYDGTSKELVMIDYDRNEASFLKGTNDLNKNFEGQKEISEKISKANKEREDRLKWTKD